MDVSDDGLLCPEVGSWAAEKHGLVSMYAKLFSTGMKNKWKSRVYIELYAGAGLYRIRDSTRIIAGSPITALHLDNPFDKYIFCEKRPEELEALKARASQIARSANISYILGDCNERVGDILGEIPTHSTGHGVLSLCFADPYDIGIRFDTFRNLSDRYVDFLVLLALYSEANRAYKRYLMEDADKVDNFLGSNSSAVRLGHSRRLRSPNRCQTDRTPPSLREAARLKEISLLQVKKEWVVSIRDQCKVARVPFFFKQWGGFRKVRNGRILDGHTYNEYPARRCVDVPDRGTCASFADSLRELVGQLMRQPDLVQLTM